MQPTYQKQLKINPDSYREKAKNGKCLCLQGFGIEVFLQKKIMTLYLHIIEVSNYPLVYSFFT